MKAAMRLLILVADPGRARIYSTSTPVLGLDAVYNQTNFSARKKPDSPGAPFTGIHHDSCTMAEDDETAFINDVCKVLQTRLSMDGYDGLVMIAPRPLLDRFLSQLDRQYHDRLTGTIVKSPGPMTEQDVIRVLTHM